MKELVIMTEIIKKWRDSLIDPMKIPFKNISLDKIISYPYAGNDVFEYVGKYKIGMLISF